MRFLSGYLFCILIFTGFSKSYTQTNIYVSDYDATNDVVKIEEFEYKRDSISSFFNDFQNSNIYKKELMIEKHMLFSYGLIEESIFFDHYLSQDANPRTYYYIHDVLNNQYVYGSVGYNKSSKRIEKYPGEFYALHGTKPFQFAFYANKYKKIKKSNNLVVVDNESLELINDNLVKHTYPGLFTLENYKIYNNNGQLVEFNGEYQYEKYKYYSDGLLKEVVEVETPDKKRFYFYKKDKHGNWIQSLVVYSSPNDKKSETIILSTRKLTYANGDITGGIDYDLNFIEHYLKEYNEVAFVKATNSKKTGCISGDCINGQGKYIFDNGNIYEGQFKDGAFNGYGKVFDKNNIIVFEGNYEEWKQNGEGTIYYTNGDIYKGNIKNGIIEGEGVFTWKNGSKYEGGFSNGLRSGIGIYTDKNGGKTKGTFKNGQLNGNGTYLGEEYTYEGEFLEGKYHGQGKFIDKINNIKYIGTFVNGQINGPTKAYFKEKLVYDGGMKNFLNEGEGTVYDYYNGKKQVNIYKEGKVVKTLSTSDISGTVNTNNKEEPNDNKNSKNSLADSDLSYCQSQENEAKCLAGKIDEQINQLETGGASQTKIDQELLNKISVIADYDIMVLYDILMEVNSKSYKTLTPLIKKLPQSQQDKIKEIANEVISDYAKQQAEYRRKQANKTYTENSTPNSVITTNKKGCVSGDCENGEGSYVWDSGSRYEGQWRNGKMQGKGAYFFEDGRVYVGDWKNDDRTYGVQTWTNGDEYEGEWLNDYMNGNGVYRWNSGARYEGHWKNGNRHGFGKEYDSNGEIYYEGEYKDDKKIEVKD